MRCAADKATRVCVTLLLVVFMVYLGNYGTQEQHTHILPLIKPIQNGSPAPPAKSAPPSRTMRPYKVVKNKVVYLDRSETTAPQLSKTFNLNEVDYSKYNDEVRLVFSTHTNK